MNVATVSPNACTESVLTELGKGVLQFSRDQYRRHCYRPETMTKRTVWALYELGLKLKADGLRYNKLKLDEIRRLLALAPQRIKSQLVMSERI